MDSLDRSIMEIFGLGILLVLLVIAFGTILYFLMFYTPGTKTTEGILTSYTTGTVPTNNHMATFLTGGIPIHIGWLKGNLNDSVGLNVTCTIVTSGYNLVSSSCS